MVDMITVQSSTVDSIGWDADNQELIVEFKNGSQYAYPDAGKGAYDDLMTSTSPGSYINRHLKNTHYRKIR